MRRWSTTLVAAAAVVSLLLGGAFGAFAQTDDEIARMRAAMPAKPRVAPAKPRTLLVFSLCRGFVHSAVPYGAKAFEILGETTGAYTVVQSSDIAVFEPGALGQFDAVVFNNTTGELFLPPDLANLSQEEQLQARERDARLKASLLEFIRSGKGVIGVHAATDTFYNWPEYGELMGGYFNGHPWNEDVAVKIDDPAHPVNRAFKGQGFTVADEIYQFKEPYSRKKLRVLLSLDTSKTDMTKGGINRDDGDFAVSWVRGYGQGRVFYCSLGHRHEIFWTPAILQHYLDGIQFALGDLAADVTPSAQLPADYAGKAMTALETTLVDEAAHALATYNLGGAPTNLRFLETVVNDTYARSESRRAVAERLAAILSDPAATLDAKRSVCSQLYHLGVPEVTPLVAPLLSDPNLSDAARYALERIETPEVDQAYLEALPKASGNARLGLINGLGERRSQAAVDALAALAADPDAGVAGAAIIALGKIGGARAAETLAGREQGLPAGLIPVLLDARLLCADGLLVEGQTAQAQAIYDAVYRSECPDRFRVAALRGMVQAQGDNAAAVVVDALRQGSPALREAAAAAVRSVPGGEAATRAFAAELPGLLAETQALLLIALADRAGPAALDAVMQAAKSEDERVRNAALETLAVLGDEGSVTLLTKLAAANEGRTQELARRALNRLRGPNINAALADRMQNAPAPPERVEAARALGERFASDTTPALLAAAVDRAPEVRVAALDALATVAPQDALPQLVAGIVAAQDNATRNAAENAAMVVGLRAEKNGGRAKPLLAAFASADTGAEAKAALLRVLGQIGDEAAMPAVLNAAGSGDGGEVRATALRVLSDWPGAAPMDTLLGFARNASNETDRIIALRGYVRMVAMPSDRDAQQTLALYREVCALAKTAEEKKLVLSGLAKMGHPDALEVIRPYLEDNEVKEEAKLAAEAIQGATYQTSASVASDASANAIDNDIETRWDTGVQQQPGQWFMLDLGWTGNVARIILDASKSPQDYPRGYEVYISSNTENWGEPVAKGEGKEPITVIDCKNTKGRYIRIVQTGSADGWFWSIHELKVEAR